MGNWAVKGSFTKVCLRIQNTLTIWHAIYSMQKQSTKCVGPQ